MTHFMDNEFMFSNSLHFLLLIAGLTFLLHIPLWCGFNMCRLKWKHLDYVWPILAGVGLLGAVSEIRSSVADDWAQTETTRALASIEAIENLSLHKLKSDICSGLSPLNGSSIYHESCSWFLNVAQTLNQTNIESLPTLQLSDFPTLDFDSELIEDDVIWIESRLLEYQEHKRNLENTQAAKLKQPFERSLWYFGPYLICIAIALRLTKVTAELKLEKVR